MQKVNQRSNELRKSFKELKERIAKRYSHSFSILKMIDEEMAEMLNEKGFTLEDDTSSTQEAPKGCGKAIHIGACHFVCCGEGGYNKDLWLCNKCKVLAKEAPNRQKSSDTERRVLEADYTTEAGATPAIATDIAKELNKDYAKVVGAENE
jgi:hypothetical protein